MPSGTHINKWQIIKTKLLLLVYLSFECHISTQKEAVKCYRSIFLALLIRPPIFVTKLKAFFLHFAGSRDNQQACIILLKVKCNEIPRSLIFR